jgi:ankyrin repeat protein
MSRWRLAVKSALFGVLGLMFLVPPSLFAQASAKVDFGKEVQPLLKEHCISCHGPSQQMNGFRLDRRSAAMRGGTFPVIAPGNSAGSRLYHKLIGTEFGQRMPPTGPLSEGDIAILKNWIDQGAEWPDALAGEVAPKPPDPAARKLMDGLRRGDVAGFRRDLAANRSGANASGLAGTTPLMYAALYGDVEAMRQLLEAGADPNVASDSGSTALMLAIHDPAKTRLLLDAGANPNIRPDDGRTALIVAASQFGSSAVVKLLLDRGATASAATANRTTALRLAAGTGDAEVMRLLVERGADLKADAGAALTQALLAKCRACVDLVIQHVDRRAFSDALVTMARWGDTDAVRLLLDRGADVNARDGDGRTALMLACYSDTYPIDVVRILIERGADVNARTPSGETAVSFAAARGGVIVEALGRAGAAPVATPSLVVPTPRPSHTARAAVQLSVPLLQKTDETFLRKSGCVSCHNDSLTAMTVALARQHRFAVDENLARSHIARMGPFLESWRESVLRGAGIPGAQDTVSYILLGMGAAGYRSDAATEAMAHYLKARQLPDGHWRVQAHRPPIESSDFEVTAVSMRSLQLFHPVPQRSDYERAIQLAADWLASNRAATTEDRAFQLLGLGWAGVEKKTIERLAQDLLKDQRPDGGWAPLPAASMQSDAYATGQVLVALRDSGVLTITSPAYTRGVRFLLDTQLADGSWHVRSRAIPVQAYFESDFPHGHDQWISAAATNWATMALIPAAQP